MSTLLQQVNDDAAHIGDRVLSSLAQINSGHRSVGAGAIWHSDGLILTNAHVVLGRHGQVADTLAVTLRDGREFPARLVAYDIQRDLAALRIDAHGLTSVEVGNSRHLRPGDFVMSLGFPWGAKGGATTGVIIGSGTDLPELGNGHHEWIAASLHLRPGHSGGPMVDSRGRVIGINTLMNGPEVGIAIPAHVAEEFLRGITNAPLQPIGEATISM